MSDEDIRRKLSRSDDQFRLLRDEHRRCEMRLQDLADRVPLSDEEEREERELKKKKLHLRDQMESRIRQARPRA